MSTSMPHKHQCTPSILYYINHTHPHPNSLLQPAHKPLKRSSFTLLLHPSMCVCACTYAHMGGCARHSYMSMHIQPERASEFLQWNERQPTTDLSSVRAFKRRHALDVVHQLTHHHPQEHWERGPATIITHLMLTVISLLCTSLRHHW